MPTKKKTVHKGILKRTKKIKTKVDIDSCSPANQNNSTSCFTYNALVKIAKG